MVIPVGVARVIPMGVARVSSLWVCNVTSAILQVFFTEEYLDNNPKARPLVPKLKALMEELVSADTHTRPLLLNAGCAISFLFFPTLYPFPSLQCQVCENGVELHAQVRPDTMKGLHQRMEELLQDYR